MSLSDDFLYTCFPLETLIDRLAEYEAHGGTKAWLRAQERTEGELREEWEAANYSEQTFERKALSELLKEASQCRQLVVDLSHRPYLNTFFQLNPFSLMEGLCLFVRALSIQKVILMTDERGVETGETLKGSLEAFRRQFTDAPSFELVLHGEVHRPCFFSAWDQRAQAQGQEFVGPSWVAQTEADGLVSVDPLTFLALMWITRFGAGSFNQRFGGQRQPVLLEVEGAVSQPGLYEVSADQAIFEFLELKAGSQALKAVALNYPYGTLLTMDQVMSWSFRYEEWKKYGVRLGPGKILVIPIDQKMRELAEMAVIRFLDERRFSHQPEWLAAQGFLRWLGLNKEQANVDVEVKKQAQELVDIIRPLISLKEGPSAYLFGRFLLSLIENFSDDLLPKIEEEARA